MKYFLKMTEYRHFGKKVVYIFVANFLKKVFNIGRI